MNIGLTNENRMSVQEKEKAKTTFRGFSPNFIGSITTILSSTDFYVTSDIAIAKNPTEIFTLYLNDNYLSGLVNVSDLYNLIDVNLGNNDIFDFIVSENNSSLQTISLYNSQIAFLKLNYLAQLNFVDLSGNANLSSLDITGCNNITYLNCGTCAFGEAAINNILVTLNSFKTSSGTCTILGNAAPSETGLLAINDLLNRDWTIIT
jgi:hypothetical protein